jgi:hypothetical protein
MPIARRPPGSQSESHLDAWHHHRGRPIASLAVVDTDRSIVAGFYSYTVLENLIGCQMKNAERIHSQWQDLKTGDKILIHPNAKPLDVVELEPEAHLVLEQTEPLHWTWSFCLIPRSNDTRLLIRTRVWWERGSIGVLAYPVMTVGHYLMERKMLTGIKSRVELATKNQRG